MLHRQLLWIEGQCPLLLFSLLGFHWIDALILDVLLENSYLDVAERFRINKKDSCPSLILVFNGFLAIIKAL